MFNTLNNYIAMSNYIFHKFSSIVSIVNNQENVAVKNTEYISPGISSTHSFTIMLRKSWPTKLCANVGFETKEKVGTLVSYNSYWCLSIGILLGAAVFGFVGLLYG